MASVGDRLEYNDTTVNSHNREEKVVTPELALVFSTPHDSSSRTRTSLVDDGAALSSFKHAAVEHPVLSAAGQALAAETTTPPSMS